MNYISVNGRTQPGEQAALLASNRGYRYGDGLFETMKLVESSIPLAELHFERLFSGLSLLKFEIPSFFTPGRLQEEIIRLCKKNNAEALARVRLSVYRGNGGLYDEGKGLEWVIETWPLDKTINDINNHGLVIGIYPDAAKSCDRFANLKSANALPYAMAALYAKEKQWNDCLVLNTKGTIADSSIANIFIIKQGLVITPPLSDGCVNGVMRRYLMEKINSNNDEGIKIKEESILPSDLETAEEIFLTNAVRGIQWVGQYGSLVLSNKITLEIYSRYGK